MTDRILIRRSLLTVPLTDPASAERAARHNADVIVLDAGDILGREAPDNARATMHAAIAAAGAGGAEVFVRLTPGYTRAEIDASATRGLTGYLLPVAESLAEVAAVARHLDRTEGRRALKGGHLEIFVLAVGARAVWGIRDIVTASPRVRSVALDEGALAADLGIVARADFDPFAYARGRVVVESIAAGRQPVGLCHPLSLIPQRVTDGELTTHATTARNSGFKGAFCADPTWVEPLNAAFSPTSEQVAYYREVRKAFAAGIARGTAAVPYDGRMVDVPVDERARMMIHLWEECQRRDAEKAAARTRTISPAGVAPA